MFLQGPYDPGRQQTTPTKFNHIKCTGSLKEMEKKMINAPQACVVSHSVATKSATNANIPDIWRHLSTQQKGHGVAA